MKVLVEAGADPNAGDLYTSPGMMAREKHLHTLQGGVHSLVFFILPMVLSHQLIPD